MPRKPRPAVADRTGRYGWAAAAVSLLMLAALPAGGFSTRIAFSEKDLGGFPAAWKAREQAGKDAYTVRREGADVFLHAESLADSHSIGRDLSIDPGELPLMSFSWRALGLPDGGNERARETNDGALGVYVIFEGWSVPPRAIKYVWSTTLPQGTVTPSPFSGKTKIVVLRSGREELGEWVEERVNVLEDYRRLFGESEVPRIKGIGLLTDSDNTGSSSSGDYGALGFDREGERLSGLTR